LNRGSQRASEIPILETEGPRRAQDQAEVVRLTKRGQPLSLSRKEFDLLAALLAKENAVVPRLELMRAVWGYAGSVITRTIDTHIAELRRKLEDNPRLPEHILIVPTIGYRLRRG
jgi:DNA-binding response OmpR family regulator